MTVGILGSGSELWEPEPYTQRQVLALLADLDRATADSVLDFADFPRVAVYTGSAFAVHDIADIYQALLKS